MERINLNTNFGCVVFVKHQKGKEKVLLNKIQTVIASKTRIPCLFKPSYEVRFVAFLSVRKWELKLYCNVA